MRIILLGSPGAGKGTQANFICKKWCIPIVSTGDMLRNAIKIGSSLGKNVKNIIDSGDLVPDEIIINLLKARINKQDCSKGFLLDGFPRTLPQAEALQNSNIKIDVVIEIFVRKELLIKRLSGRRIHKESGRTYHIEYNPPKKANIDDITGEPLIQRKDDKKKVILNRLSVYEKTTAPLIDYYREMSNVETKNTTLFASIDGEQTIDKIRQKIFKLLNTTCYT